MFEDSQGVLHATKEALDEREAVIVLDRISVKLKARQWAQDRPAEAAACRARAALREELVRKAKAEGKAVIYTQSTFAPIATVKE